MQSQILVFGLFRVLQKDSLEQIPTYMILSPHYFVTRTVANQKISYIIDQCSVNTL